MLRCALHDKRIDILMLKILLCCFVLIMSLITQAQPMPAPTPRTYCNPLNLDYGYTPIPDFVTAGRHRATADPVITRYKGDYYLFSTNQWGYWWSPDLSSWHFIARHFLRPEHKVYDDLCAPAVFVRCQREFPPEPTGRSARMSEPFLELVEITKTYPGVTALVGATCQFLSSTMQDRIDATR